MSAPSDLFLTVDMQNRRLVSFSGLPDQYQSNTISLKVQCVNPGSSVIGGAGNTSYVVQNMGGGFGMRAAVGPKPEGISGPTVLALQNAMTWDAANNVFVGDLPLNTTGIDDYIAEEDSATAWFELNLTTATGTRITILQTTFTLRAVVDELLSLVPTPVDVYHTAAVSDAKYMPRIGAPGDVLTLLSPDGTKRMEIGVDNNGNETRNFIA